MTLEQLKPFCSRDLTRTGILEPFTVGPYTYATDGRIIVRVPAIPDAPQPADHPKQPDEVFPRDTGYKPVLLPPGWREFKPAIRHCSDCGGFGYYKTCTACDGAGSQTCDHCNNTENCELCQGSGYIADSNRNATMCDNCDGRGEYEATFAVSLNAGACAVTLHYLRLVHTLPGAKLRYRGEKMPLLIDFDGGDGVLMPTQQADNDGVPLIDQWKPSPVPA